MRVWREASGEKVNPFALSLERRNASIGFSDAPVRLAGTAGRNKGRKDHQTFVSDRGAAKARAPKSSATKKQFMHRNKDMAAGYLFSDAREIICFAVSNRSSTVCKFLFFSLTSLAGMWRDEMLLI